MSLPVQAGQRRAALIHEQGRRAIRPELYERTSRAHELRARTNFAHERHSRTKKLRGLKGTPIERSNERTLALYVGS